MAYFQDIGVGTRKRRLLMPSVQETKSSAFDHETKTPIENYQTGQVNGFVTPVNSLTENDDGPFEFVIPPQDGAYLMMNSLMLYVKGQVLRGNNTPMDNDVVAPINLLGSSIWEHVELSLNDRILNASSGSHSHYKAYIETILSYDRTAKDGHLRAQIFAMDTPGAYNVKAVGADSANKGFNQRNYMVANSRIFDMMAPVQCDFLRSNNHLTPRNKLTLKLTRTRNSFLFVRDDNNNNTFKLRILELKLYYQRLIVRPDARLPNPERYLYTRTELKKLTVPPLIQQRTFQLVEGGIMPSSVIICQVLAAAANGAWGENPYFFHHFHVSKLNLVVNGQMVPSQPLKPDFTDYPGLVARSLMSMYQNTGAYGMHRGSMVDITAFHDGATIFPIVSTFYLSG